MTFEVKEPVLVIGLGGVGIRLASEIRETLGADSLKISQDKKDVSDVKRRSKVAYELICKISKENNEKWIGWKGEAVFDEEFESQKRGRNFAYKPIFVSEEPKIGDIRTVEITDATVHSLIGKIIK